MLMVMKYKGFAPIERNWIFTTIVAKCILNRSIRFRKEEMFSVIKYKDFLLDNINHVKELNKIFNAITSVVDYYILSDISISDIRLRVSSNLVLKLTREKKTNIINKDHHVWYLNFRCSDAHLKLSAEDLNIRPRV